MAVRNGRPAVALARVSAFALLGLAAAAGAATSTSAAEPAGGLPTLYVSNASFPESAPTASFTVTLSAPSGQTVTVQYATANGTAVQPGDYTATSGTVTFLAGDTSETVSVSIVSDSIDEADETFYVNLMAPTNATISDGQGLGTIYDDDVQPSVSINNDSVSESSGPAEFTVSLTAASGRDVSVLWSTANDTATQPQDYQQSSGMVTIPPGATSATLSVTIVNDTLDENDETFFVNLGTPTNASVMDGQGVATIIDNDPQPSVSIGDTSVAESATHATFAVSLSTASGRQVSVPWSTANDTATQSQDYAQSSGTLIIPPGVTSITLSVPIVNDSLDEDSESFFVNLGIPTAATVGDGQGAATITDNDVPPLVSVDDEPISEGSGTASFTVSLSAPSGRSISVSYATANNTAVASDDYTSAAGSVTFSPGDTSEPINVTVNNDALDENNETFFVNLSTPTNVNIGDGQGTATIIDDDPTPGVWVDDHWVIEGAAVASFEVNLSAPSGLMVSVPWFTTDDSANASDDYAAASGTLFIAPGETSQSVTVALINDGADEPDETFLLQLGEPTNATIFDGQGIATILDNDAPACATAPFSDVSIEHAFCAEIGWMKDSGISTGFDDGTYRPSLPVSRQAMSAFMARLAGATLTTCTEDPFSDVAADHPFCREITWMKEAGISTGFPDETYRPAISVTRQAMSAFMARLAGADLTSCTAAPFDDVAVDHPFCAEIKWMKDTGISTGFDDNTYRPGIAVTRQAMSAFMVRLEPMLAL